jgi:hypothetical protein
MFSMSKVMIFIFSFAALAGAHHSAAATYDMEKPVVKLKGTVTKVEWKNPHIWCYIDVTDSDGKVKVWEIEIQGNPSSFFRRGWKKDSVKVGDVVTVEGFPPRELGLNHILSRSLILPDGRALGS